MKVCRIAICDDNIPLCSDIEKFILNYPEEKSVPLYVEIYYSGNRLCEDLKKGIIYDMIFLDIELGGGTDGIDVGHYIRDELNDEIIQIIYISSHKKYALDLFKVRPMDFLIKPITEDMICGSIKTGLKIIGKNEITFQYKKGRDWNTKYIKDILYFKSNDREVEMVTTKEKITFYESLGNIYRQLEPYRFFYAHKSFLVNYFHIREFYYERLIMSNKEVIKIAQSRRKTVREIQKKYLMKEVEDAD